MSVYKYGEIYTFVQITGKNFIPVIYTIVLTLSTRFLTTYYKLLK